MLIFVATEVMFFLGFISAFSIVKAGSVMWPPPNQPRLPVEITSLNTFVLFLSALCFFLCNAPLKKQDTKNFSNWFRLGVVSATLFVAIQGYEWVTLISYGLTMQSSPYGSFFYMIIGCHGLHAVIAILFMLLALPKVKKGTLKKESFYTLQTFWFFVVGIWPLLFGVVYF